MDTQNPYDSPKAEPIEITTAFAARSAKGSPTDSTVLPRQIAAILDNLIAMILGILAAKSAEGLPAVQVPVFGAVYLGYYLLFEGFISRTPGKLLTGLVVIQIDGQRCTWRQSLIRTVFRIVEVNPVFMIPAALSIVFSRHHQRFGDKAAQTVVVPSRRVAEIR
jgi:uncharacterized RDD family membrane protein YckC